MLIANLFSNPVAFVVLITAFVIGLTVHEFAHAYVANRCGDPTAKYMGRLSLNPFRHLDLVGSLFFLIAGFGFAKPVPINPNNLEKKEDELKIAFAGIAANILLALVLALPIRYALWNGQTIDSSLWLTLLNYYVEVNLILAAFNLLPIFPLDGSHLVEYFLSEEAKDAYRSAGMPILFGLLVFNSFTNISILTIVMEPILRVLSFLVRGTLTS